MKVISGLSGLVQQKRFFLYSGIAIGILMLLLQFFFSYDLYRDAAAVYAPMVRDLATGNYNEAFHPGIPCLNVILSFPFTCLGMLPEKALGTVSCLFYIFTVPLVFLLLLKFLPERLAALGSLLFACAPKIIRFSCAAIIDSGKLFFMTAALLLLVKIIEEEYRSWKTAFLFGAALGGLALSRSEGIGNAVVFCGLLALYWVADSLRSRKIQLIRAVSFAVIPFLCCILLRIWINWHFCGTAVFDSRLSDGFSHLFSAFRHTSAAAGQTAAEEFGHRVSWADLLNQNIRGAYELYLMFAVIGLMLVIFSSRKNADKLWPEARQPLFVRRNRLYWLLLLVPLGNALIFKASDIAAYRYFLLNIPCLMVFTVIGAYFIGTWFLRFLPRWLLAVICVAAVVFQIRNGTENIFQAGARAQYETGKQIGRLLAGEKETAKVWFGACIEWYYSGLKRALPIESGRQDFSKFSNFDYVLWEEDRTGYETLRERPDLREIPLQDAGDVHLFKRLK